VRRARDRDAVVRRGDRRIADLLLEVPRREVGLDHVGAGRERDPDVVRGAIEQRDVPREERAAHDHEREARADPRIVGAQRVRALEHRERPPEVRRAPPRLVARADQEPVGLVVGLRRRLREQRLDGARRERDRLRDLIHHER